MLPFVTNVESRIMLSKQMCDGSDSMGSVRGPEP